MTTEIQLRSDPLEPRSQAEALQLATVAAASKLLGVRSAEEAYVLLKTGRELGLSAMQSLRGIHVIQGRPTLSADLCVAVVRASDRCVYWHTVESTPERCTIETQRRGDPGPVRRTWTREDAERAKLLTRDMWRQYPAQMLRHRCAADLAREVYPDLLLGLYTPDELAGVEAPETRPPSVTVEQVVVEVPPTPAPAPAPQNTPAPALGTDWLKRIERAAASPKSVGELIRLGTALAAAELNGARATVLAVYVAALGKKLCALPDLPTLQGAADHLDKIPETLAPEVAGPLREIVKRRVIELGGKWVEPETETPAAPEAAE